MKKFCLLVVIFCFTMISNTNVTYAQRVYSETSISSLGRNSTPRPFQEINNPKARVAISTGYYFADVTLGDASYAQWMPGPSPDGNMFLLPLGFEPHLWFRVYSGPRQVPYNEVESGYDHFNHLILPPANGRTPKEGYRYFRNPAQHARYLNKLDNAPGIDTVMNAIAGPIPIGFAFFVNGIRYDSFYVSPRGIIALSNRRYLYDGDGNRAIPPTKTDCYDPMSADWPFFNPNGTLKTGRIHSAPGSAESLNDPVYDNYGFVNIACGGNPLDANGGIRTPRLNADLIGNFGGAQDTPPTDMGSMEVRLGELTNNGMEGGAYITPMEGPFWLPQWNDKLKASDDWGQVWYKRSMTSDKLIIYFKNLQLEPGQYSFRPPDGGTPNDVYNVRDGRPFDVNYSPDGDGDVLSGSCQVELNRLDSSITFRYGEFFGTITRLGGGVVLPANNFIQPFASIAVGGYARHKGYNTKDPSTWERAETEPWAEQYVQSTQQFNGYPGKLLIPRRQFNSNVLLKSYAVKFKQWKNSLKLTDIQYYVRKKVAGATAFDVVVKTEQVRDNYDPFELLAGHDVLGEMQPVGIVQNLTNDIQGTDGVNFVAQDFQFQARLLVKNKVTEKYVYNRFAKISEHCLYLSEGVADQLCGNDPYALVRYSNVTKEGKNYVATPKTISPGDINGIPPYGFALVKFPRFRPNEFLLSQIGLMEVAAITEPINPNTNEVIGDDWPFDDTNKIDFWVVNRLQDFRNNGEFHSIRGVGSVPSVNQFVYSRFSESQSSLEVLRASESTSDYPLPPLGPTRALNENSSTSLVSPMFKMYWRNYEGKSTGSKITSFPIDLRNRNGSIMSLGVQRGLADLPINRGFADAKMHGPEARVVFNGGYDTLGDFRTGKIDRANGGLQTTDPDFDYLALEYLKPSDDGIKKITMTGSDDIKNNSYNTGANNFNPVWRYHPYWENYRVATTPAPKQNAPALAIYGGGGYFLGWTYANKKTYYPANWNGGSVGTNDAYGGGGTVYYNIVTDKYRDAINPGIGNPIPVAGLMYNPFDVGFDYEFYNYSVVIPDYFIEASPVDLGKNFRFRIRFIETNDRDGDGDKQGVNGPPPNPEDDDDAVLVDNIAVVFPDVNTDIEASAVRVVWPYTVVPATQANDLKITARVANTGTSAAVPFMIKVRAFIGETPGSPSEAIYCQTQRISQLSRGVTTEIDFLNFNARNFVQTSVGETSFCLQMIVVYPGQGDNYRRNDTTLSVFKLRFGDEISYAPLGAKNDVAEEVGISGKGLNLLGASFSGYNIDVGQAPQRISTPRYTNRDRAFDYMQYWQINATSAALPWLDWVCGGGYHSERPGYPNDGPLTGQIAMKFELTEADSVKGVNAMFANANLAFDDISFYIYEDKNGLPVIPVNNKNLPLIARRLLAKNANGTESKKPMTNEFVRYEFAEPIRLEKGTYWLSIEQRAETGLELAASGASMGMRTMLVSATQKDIGGEIGNIGELGGTGIQIMLDKRFRQATKDAANNRVYGNNNVFAYKNITSEWKPFMPTIGHVGYAHLDHFGRLGKNQVEYNTFTRGTWMPLLTPYFGVKSVNFDEKHYPCPDDVAGDKPLSIEVTAFGGNVRNGGIDLTWETASEVNNHSFIVERANADGIWKEVATVAGAGNSTTPNRYNFRDNDVASGNTYQYRLYNISFDGTVSCQNNNVISVEYTDSRRIELAQNSPNPFNSETAISFFVPEAQNVTLEVVDIFGRIVKTLVDNETLKGTQNINWTGTDNAGMKVADGNYLYRLTAGSEILTKKMSYIKSK